MRDREKIPDRPRLGLIYRLRKRRKKNSAGWRQDRGAGTSKDSTREVVVVVERLNGLQSMGATRLGKREGLEGREGREGPYSIMIHVYR